MGTMQWVGLLLLAVFAGAVVPFQSAININLARGVGHPLWATFTSLVVSVLVLLPVIVVLRLPLPSLAPLGKLPLWMWTGGAFGVCFVALAVVLLPKLGASGFLALALAGQMITSIVLDHFGLFGLVENHLTLPRLFGALLLVAGVLLIQFSPVLEKSATAVG
ncbi:transporter family-2 protein [Pseudomonas sp. LAIL14HWK12:I2]|jgi:transporter family-2 protein|uniref:DMT family transporter n=1 Tax=Pseudomonas sp. LAIL14HWK12:I2 TaxID=1265482 RepID=UPI001067D81C|nr:DMT family transporter [Pseudomonas sp. LAIL14HWK12:I2]TFA82535.1 transporter family-2 protein [Pseudomonas sp. LAIL14HWK12:I2]